MYKTAHKVIDICCTNIVRPSVHPSVCFPVQQSVQMSVVFCLIYLTFVVTIFTICIQGFDCNFLLYHFGLFYLIFYYKHIRYFSFFVFYILCCLNFLIARLTVKSTTIFLYFYYFLKTYISILMLLQQLFLW